MASSCPNGDATAADHRRRTSSPPCASTVGRRRRARARIRTMRLAATAAAAALGVGAALTASGSGPAVVEAWTDLRPAVVPSRAASAGTAAARWTGRGLGSGSGVGAGSGGQRRRGSPPVLVPVPVPLTLPSALGAAHAAVAAKPATAASVGHSRTAPFSGPRARMLLNNSLRVRAKNDGSGCDEGGEDPGSISSRRGRRWRRRAIKLLAASAVLLAAWALRPREAIAEGIAMAASAVKAESLSLPQAAAASSAAAADAAASAAAATAALSPNPAGAIGSLGSFRSPLSLTAQLDLCCRLLCASLGGAAVGLERSSSDRPAGVRTMALVSLGAAAFSVCSMYSFLGVAADAAAGGALAKFDPSRMASNVASGVGFIGAGVITNNRKAAGVYDRQSSVNGLTTAAAIWVSAAIGVACGTGLYFVGTVAALSTIGILRFGRVRSTEWGKRVMSVGKKRRKRRGSAGAPAAQAQAGAAAATTATAAEAPPPPPPSGGGTTPQQQPQQQQPPPTAVPPSPPPPSFSAAIIAGDGLSGTVRGGPASAGIAGDLLEEAREHEEFPEPELVPELPPREVVSKMGLLGSSGETTGGGGGVSGGGADNAPARRSASASDPLSASASHPPLIGSDGETRKTETATTTAAKAGVGTGAATVLGSDGDDDVAKKTKKKKTKKKKQKQQKQQQQPPQQQGSQVSSDPLMEKYLWGSSGVGGVSSSGGGSVPTPTPTPAPAPARVSVEEEQEVVLRKDDRGGGGGGGDGPSAASAPSSGQAP